MVENVNVAPPFELTRALDDALALTLKSPASPTVGPLAATDVTVHNIGAPTRCGLPATHKSVEAVVGIATAQVGPR